MMLDKDLGYNLLFTCLVIKKYHDQLNPHAASKLNNMLQERGGMSAQQAFTLIWDGLMNGFFTVCNDNDQKKLVVNDEKYNKLRDDYINDLSGIQSEVAGSRWSFRGKIRDQLSPEEKMHFDKNVSKGRLKSMQTNQVETGNKEILDDLKKHLAEPLVNFANQHKNEDFVITIEKQGSKLIPTIKVVERKDEISIEWAKK